MNEQVTSAPQRGTGLAFVRHWDWVAEKGLMHPTTARAIRAAVSQILKIDQNWESVDVHALDVEALLGRFRNLSKLAPGSLATYESRFRTGLESYLAYLNNPASYQPKSRRSTSREEGKNVKVKPGTPFVSQPSVPSNTGSGAVGTPRLVVYPFPVRPDVFAELKLPADLTLDEATRLGNFLKAVALSDGTSSK
jgi:hypothetical protein